MTQLLLFNVTNGLIIGAFYVLMAIGLSHVPLEAAVQRTASPLFSLGWDLCPWRRRRCRAAREGLRVVDASVIPVIPSCNIMAQVLAIAEIAARQIQRG